MLDAFDKALTAMVYAAAGLAVFAIVWAGFVVMAEGAERPPVGPCPSGSIHRDCRTGPCDVREGCGARTAERHCSHSIRQGEPT